MFTRSTELQKSRSRSYNIIIFQYFSEGMKEGMSEGRLVVSVPYVIFRFISDILIGEGFIDWVRLFATGIHPRSRIALEEPKE